MKNPLETITAAQVKVFLTVVLSAVYPGMDAEFRVTLIGAVVSIYVLATAYVKGQAHKARKDNVSR